MRGDEASREMGAEMTGGAGETGGAGTAGGTSAGPETGGAGMASVGMGTDLAGEGGGTADDDLTDDATDVGTDVGAGADESGLASGGLETEEGAPT